jgi:tetratricopeptide (TPR) repeat protein
LAWAYGSAASRGIEPEANSRAALAAAQRAVELDPMDPDAHAALGDMVGDTGDFPRAKAEFETALRLNPGDVETLTHYAGWASTFGEPERGAAAADRALRLNPNAPNWAYGFFSNAYFMVGRYDDAVRSIERRPLDSLGRGSLVLRAALYAAVDRIDDAHRAVADTLARYPDLTIEGFISDPGWNDVERGKYMQAMRKAGFPACASANALTKIAKPVHLPECTRPQSTG